MSIRLILAVATLTLSFVATSRLPVTAQTLPSAPVVTAQAPDVAATAQSLVSLLSSGDYAGARNLYDPTNTSVTPDTIRQSWSDVVAQFGSLQEQVSTRTLPLENPAGGTMAIVTAQFANGRSNIYITFNPQGQAVSFDLVQE